MDLDTLTTRFLDHLAARNRLCGDLDGIDAFPAVSRRSITAPSSPRGRTPDRRPRRSPR
jgi:hypothetical protein